MKASEVEPKRVLIIKLHGVGDVIWTTPFLNNLRKGFPAARIAFLTRVPYEALLENNPDVDEVIVLKKTGIGSQLDFLLSIRKADFDLTIDLIGTPRSALITWASGSEVRMGYDFGYRRFFYNRLLSAQEANRGHEVEFHLHPLKVLGLEISSKHLVYNLSPEEKTYRASAWSSLGFKPEDKVIGLLPTGGWDCKRWGLDKYAELSRRMLSGGYRTLVFWGSPREHRDALEIIRSCPGSVIIPQATLRQMAALLSGCRAVVGNDSGPLHIATALKVPAVAFYGPTDPKGQGPWGVPNKVVRNETLGCLACNRIRCDKPLCMEGISADRAWQAFKVLMAES